MMRPSYKETKEKKEHNEKKEREQGFNVYLQGANAERVNSQLKREKVQKYKRNESLNKERKNWSNQEQRLFSNESNPKIFSEETKIGIDILKNENFFPPLDKNLDRKKWKSYAPVRLLPESKAEEIEESVSLELKKSLIINEDDDESLVNCIDSLDKEDINILRQSMRIVLDHNAPSKLFEKHDDIEEILEEVHDIKEEEDLPDNEPVEKEEIVEEIIPLGTLKFEKPIEFPKKNVKYIKARPISANLKEKSPNSNYVGSQPILEKKIEEKTININTNPFKSLSRPKTEISTRKTHDFIQNQKEFKESPIKTKNTRENKNNMESPLKTKGLEHLLKKIELLNEDKKQELELFLEKIVDGKLDIKSLLNFEFSSQEKHISLPSKFSNRVESSFLTKKQTEQHKRIESNINLIQNNLEMQNNYPEESFRNQKNHNVEISQNNENILRDKSLKTENIPLDKNILKLRILSTWGSIYIAGITEIHLYSVSGDRIHVSVNDLLIKNASFPNSKNLKNLINDIYETIDENNMWSGYMPAPPDCLELSMIFQRNLEIGLIYIWNYNKSLIESIKGIKEIEILLNNQLVWSGIVKRGVGNEYEDYRETIQIRRECNVSKVLNEEKEKKNEGLFEDLMPATRKTVSRAHPKTYKLFEEIENQELVRRNTGSVATEGDKTFEKIGEKCTEDEFGKNSFLGKPKGKSEKYIVDKQKLDRNLDIFEEKSKKNNIDKVDLKEKHKKSEKNDDNSKKEVFLLEKVKPLEELLVKQMEILKEGIIDKTNDSLSVDKSLQKPSGKLVQIPKEILKEKQIEKANNLDKFYSDKPLQKLAPIIEKTTIDKQIIGKSIFEKPLLDKHSDKSNLDKPIIEKSIDKIFIEKTCIKEKIFDKLIEKPTQKENEKPIEIIEKPAQKVISENLISEKPKTTDKPNEKSRMDNIFKRYTEENDQNSLDKLLYFNLTNEGRLRPGSRERFLQAEALTMQKDVQNSLKILQTNIDLNEESDDLGVFFKKEQNPFNKNERISQINPFKSKDKMENFFEYVGSECPEEIVIPLLPKGRHLSFNLLSTWGDEHYIGLAGIELFNDKGIPITLQSFQIKANPPDINILPGYGQDPRTIDKLLDGIYTTSDDLHMWLAPFTKGNNHIIQIDLGTPYRISMIRMWNYNKSRIHSFRGARNLKIQFDERKIFEGEIKKASGILENCKDRCEYIMFTSDETVISCIEKNDWLNQQQLILKNNQEKFRAKEIFQERPDTGNKDLEEIEGLLNERVGIDGRPMTSVLRTAFIDEKPKIETRNEITKETFENKGKKLRIEIMENWGDPFYTGLTGIEIFDSNQNKVNVNQKFLDARPRDLKSTPGFESDPRVLENLINGQNNTTNEKNMWLIQFIKEQKHTIFIDFAGNVNISAIKFYNYNKSLDDANRGVKRVVIILDDLYLTSKTGVVIKKAFGNTLYDFGHLINLPFPDGWSPEKLAKLSQKKEKIPKLLQEYETCNKPMGFTLKLVLLTTWGDIHYIGLNGLEIFDSDGNEIFSNKTSYKVTIGAEPSSINCLKGMQNDVRTIDKLINGVNRTFDDKNMWLAPWVGNNPNDQDNLADGMKNNTIFISFDKMIVISAITFWNYAKKPNRGVKELEVFFDENLIYKGYLKKVNSENALNRNLIEENDLKTSILFDKSREMATKIKASLNSKILNESNLLFYNEKKLMNNPKNIEDQEKLYLDQLERPMTSVKDLIILENEELLSALDTYTRENNLKKFKTDFLHLLRFFKKSNLSSVSSPKEIKEINTDFKDKYPRIKVPMCRQLSFYSQIQIHSPQSKGNSCINSPRKSCSLLKNMKSDGEIVNNKEFEKFITQLIKGEEKRDI